MYCRTAFVIILLLASMPMVICAAEEKTADYIESSSLKDVRYIGSGVIEIPAVVGEVNARVRFKLAGIIIQADNEKEFGAWITAYMEGANKVTVSSWANAFPVDPETNLGTCFLCVYPREKEMAVIVNSTAIGMGFATVDEASDRYLPEPAFKYLSDFQKALKEEGVEKGENHEK